MMSDLNAELAAAYRRTARLEYDSMVNVNRRDWTDEQWIADARQLMDHIDGSAACLLNGHVHAMLRAIDQAYQRGYDDGCDDPESVWTSTKDAFRAEGAREQWAKDREAVEVAASMSDHEPTNRVWHEQMQRIRAALDGATDEATTP